MPGAGIPLTKALNLSRAGHTIPAIMLPLTYTDAQETGMEPLPLTTDPLEQTLLDAILEQSKQQLVTMRSQLKDQPDQLAEKERAFLFSECAKLDALSNMQLQLNEYRTLHSKSKPIDKAKEARKAGNSAKLGNHLRAAGQARHGANWEAHHIVCSRHASHASARLKLFAYMGINDPINGCWLPKKHGDAKGTVLPHAVGHAYIHTNKYAAWVGRNLRMANGKTGLLNALRRMQQKMHNAKREPDVIALLTDKGKADLGVKIGGIR